MGGDFLNAFLGVRPSYESSFACLVRSQDRGKNLSSAYPGIKIVYGTLDDSDVLEAEAAKADIILHFGSSDHVGAAQAIRRGLEKGKGGIWIHTSGIDILLPPGPRGGLKGENKVFDDWEGVGECLSLPGKELSLYESA